MTKAAVLAQMGNTNQTFRNRIINGAMMIDQRNAGASVTPTSGQYMTDRWTAYLSQPSKFTAQQNQGAVTPPAGYSNYLGYTSSSAYSIGATESFFLYQAIEANNISDLNFGTANALSVTASFLVRSSLTGTFGGALSNYAQTRIYPFSFTINSANTWEQKTITIAGDTSGTWVTSGNAGAMYLWFSLGSGSSRVGTPGAWTASNVTGVTGQQNVVGTNAATFYITGVQLEAGTTATPFEQRLYGTELALCQRYLPAFVATGTNQTLPFVGCGVNSTTQAGTYTFEVQARVPPTGITVSSAAHFTNSRPSTGNTVCSAVNFAASSNYACQIELKAASGLTADVPYLLYANNASATMLFTGCEL